MTDITVGSVTDGTINGDGVFDKLMKSVTSHLDDQYSKGRIKGADYANVYLGSIQSAMQHSVTFVMGEQEAEKRVELLAAQIVEQTSGTSRAIDQLNDVILSGEKQREEINSRIVLVNTQVQEQLASTKRTDVQLDDALDNSLKQRQHVDEQISLIHVQMAETIDGTERAKEQLLDGLVTTSKQRDQMTSAIALSEVQTLEVTAGTTRSDTTSTQDNLVKASQILKFGSEKTLLDNKGATELEQSILVTKQQALYEAQKNGFARDSEQKAAKLVSDIWQIAKGTDPNGYVIPVTETEIGNVLRNAVKGAGLEYSTLTP